MESWPLDKGFQEDGTDAVAGLPVVGEPSFGRAEVVPLNLIGKLTFLLTALPNVRVVTGYCATRSGCPAP
jgi:hypothetical protein